ncbi:transposase [Pedobacter caeni]
MISVNHTKKKVHSDQGDMAIQVPRDRDGSFNPIIVPKQHNMIDGLKK